MAGTSTELELPAAPPSGLVVDCSVTLAWFLVDEENELAEQILARVDRIELWSPPIWRYELANGLAIALRRGRLTPENWKEAIREAARTPVRIDPALPGLAELAELAAAHRLTAYDAAYLELALRRRLPLATLDTALAAAATERGVLYRPES